jgi:hypothetical protein
MELVKAMDEYVPEPKRDMDKPFLMPIEDVFSIKGRGTVATGRIETGIVIKSTKKLKLSVSGILKNLLLLVSKHSRKTLTKVKLVTMLESFFVVLNVMILNAVKLSLKLVQLLHTLSLTLKYISLPKKKADVTLHSAKVTSLSSTSVQLT